MIQDVIVIGGSYAGMAAALQVARTRRPVMVIDAGERRNRFAGHAHGFLGRDGVPPREIAREAREQLMTYANLGWLEGRAMRACKEDDGFVVETEDRRHRPFALGHGILHRLGANPHEWQRGGKIEGARDDQRRVLAKAQPGDTRQLVRVHVAKQRLVARDPDRVQRRLRDVAAVVDRPPVHGGRLGRCGDRLR